METTGYCACLNTRKGLQKNKEKETMWKPLLEQMKMSQSEE